MQEYRMKIFLSNKFKTSRLVKAVAFCLMAFVVSPAFAQQIIEIEPLFEYITAPEEMSSLQEKSDYLVEHFWDNMDFKTKNAVDQTALNHAFKVFSTPLRFSDKNKATVAVDKLIASLSKNPILMLQFTKAAEENIYGPRAEAWIDEVYEKFLDALIKNKKIQAQRKEKYAKQLFILQNSTLGSKAPSFKFTDANGKEATYFPMATPTILIFGNPTDADWRISRLRMETNAQLTQAVDKGKINILYIVPDNIDGWQSEVSNYPKGWTVGCAENLADNLDLRAKSTQYFASVWFVGSDGNIVAKNAHLESVINQALESVK